MDNLILFLTLLSLVIMSAFFSGSETAFLSLSKIKLKEMKDKKVKNYKLVTKMLSKQEFFLSTILICNNLVNNFFSSAATMLAVGIFGDAGIAVATTAATLIIITFGEILPKTFAANAGIFISNLFAPLIRIIQTIFFPVVKVFELVSRLFSRIIPPTEDDAITAEEIEVLIETGNKEGIFEKSEMDMLKKVLVFSDLRLKSIAKHFSSIEYVDSNASYEETLAKFRKSGFSKLPVVKNGDFENILGVLHYKSLLFHSGAKKNFSVKKYCRPTLFVPDSKKAASLFYVFRTEKTDFAVVVNEHGSNCGIITSDDIIHAVFGDSQRNGEEQISRLSHNEFVIFGEAPLTEVEDTLGITLESEFYNTIAGYLLEKFGKIPDEKDFFEESGFRFSVKKIAANKIQAVGAVKISGEEA